MKTSQQIRAEIEALSAELNMVRSQETTAAKQQIFDILAAHDMKLEDLSPRLAASKPAKVRAHAPLQALFSDGKDNHWSGRGRTPKWLEGKDREQYRIKKEGTAA